MRGRRALGGGSLLLFLSLTLYLCVLCGVDMDREKEWGWMSMISQNKGVMLLSLLQLCSNRALLLKIHV